MPEIDVLVGGMGTGGTLCGTGKYLKEKKPEIKLICADPYGSIIYDMFKYGKVVTPPASYQVEGIGEDIIPKNFDLPLLDDVIQMDDATAFKLSRDLLHQEGLFVGTSSGTAVASAFKWAKAHPEWSKDKNFLIIIPDNGSKYMSKTWSDEWMQEKGFFSEDLKPLKPIQYIEGAIKK
jgi:cystathionine beta-synthase